MGKKNKGNNKRGNAPAMKNPAPEQTNAVVRPNSNNTNNPGAGRTGERCK